MLFNDHEAFEQFWLCHYSNILYGLCCIKIGKLAISLTCVYFCAETHILDTLMYVNFAKLLAEFNYMMSISQKKFDLYKILEQKQFFSVNVDNQFNLLIVFVYYKWSSMMIK